MTNNRRPDAIGSQFHVLAVDDSALNRSVLEAILAPIEIDLSLCDSGASGAQVYAERGAGLILMDLLMPDADGLQSLSMVRDIEADREWARCPAVLLTATLPNSLNAGKAEQFFDGIVHKPIDANSLIAVIGEYMKCPLPITTNHKTQLC